MRNALLFVALLAPWSLFAQQTDDLIVPITSASQILIPAAGDVIGANGTHFRSDISIINLRNAAQRVQLFWLPQGASGEAVAPVTITIAALSGFSSENFVSEILQRTGLGGIHVVGVRADDTIDPDARLHVTSRIWTPRPDGASGTMSQTFPSIVVGPETASVKAIFGVRRSDQYRLNVGIVNPVETARRFNVTVAITPVGGTTVTTVFEMNLQPRSISQVGVLATTSGIVQVVIQETTTGGLQGPWHAWASSIDNESGDAWSQMAVAGQ